MAEALTIQGMIDANADVDTIEKAALEDTIVTARNGREFPSAPRAVRLILEQGTIDATLFKTRVDLDSGNALASETPVSLVDDDFALVFNDDDIDLNGYYQKQAGVWEYLPYNIQRQAINQIEQAKQTAVELSKQYTDGVASVNPKQKDVVLQLDSKGNLVYRIDSDGEYFIPNLERSIQGEFEYLKNRQGNEDGAVRGDSKSNKQIAIKHSIAQTYLDRLQNAKAYSANTSPVPHLAAPQRYSVGSAWINTVTMTANLPADNVIISGYHPQFADDIGVVHPQIWEFTEKVAGYKYWMGLNPYTNVNEAIELPFIYGSNDPEFKTWQLIESFPQPFEPDPLNELGSYRGFLSDSGFAYDFKLGDLVFFWRKTLYFDDNIHDSIEKSFEASRFNGVSWSENYDIKNLAPESGDQLLSPNIVYNAADDLYYMYTVSSGILFYRTSPDLQRGDLWSQQLPCGMGGSTVKTWHFDMKFIGDKLVVLLHADHIQTDDGKDAFYFGVSDNFVDFTVGTQSIVTNASPQLYKATFIPEFLDNSNVRFKIIYTSDAQSSPKFKLFVATTNEINLGA